MEKPDKHPSCFYVHSPIQQENFYGPSTWKKHWDHRDKLIEKLKTQMIKARSKKDNFNLSKMIDVG